MKKLLFVQKKTKSTLTLTLVIDNITRKLPSIDTYLV